MSIKKLLARDMRMNLKTVLELLEIIDRQNTLIAELVNESCEQEAIIETLMQESIQLSE